VGKTAYTARRPLPGLLPPQPQPSGRENI